MNLFIFILLVLHSYTIFAGETDDIYANKTFSQKSITAARQKKYRNSRYIQNKVMTAAEFKTRVKNKEKFSPDICYVIYAKLPEYEEVDASCDSNFDDYILSPDYYNVLNLSDIEIPKLPENLHIKGSISLNKSDIFELPKNFFVNRDLYIAECPNIIKFPDGLHVKGFVDAHDSGIVSLDNDFTIGGSLDVSGCIHLLEIPEKQLKVGADMNFNGCINIKRIPSWILYIPLNPHNHQIRMVYLQNIKVSRDKIASIIKKFQQLDQLSVEIYY